MAQTFFPIMYALDWLSLTCRSEIVCEDFLDSDTFKFTKREYGTKQYKAVFDIQRVYKDGQQQDFATLLTCPTNSAWLPTMCSLKLINSVLYDDADGTWYDLLNQFLQAYNISILNITRADIAADFLFLRNRISGPMLVKNLRNSTWWKCGSVKVSEHYSLPYSIEWSREFEHDVYDTKIYLQNGNLYPRVETLTFGSMSSNVQVCIYNKTFEIEKSAVRLEGPDGTKVAVCPKEYIRDCHKKAGVWAKDRNTWRIEIRIKHGAGVLMDTSSAKPRELTLEDLAPSNIVETYRAAAARYFRIVDPTFGGTRDLTLDQCRAYCDHKNRLPQIDLFAGQSKVAFCSARHQQPINSYHRAAIKRIDDLGERLQRNPIKETLTTDRKTLEDCANLLATLADRAGGQHSSHIRLLNLLREYVKHTETLSPMATVEELQLIARAKSVIERHVNTESPIFMRNLQSTLLDYSTRLDLSRGQSRPYRALQEAFPGDAAVLRTAAQILAGVHSSVMQDARKAAGINLYLDAAKDLLTRHSDPSTIVTHSDWELYKYIFEAKWSPFSKEVLEDLTQDTYGFSDSPGWRILAEIRMKHKEEYKDCTTNNY